MVDGGRWLCVNTAYMHKYVAKGGGTNHLMEKFFKNILGGGKFFSSFWGDKILFHDVSMTIH